MGQAKATTTDVRKAAVDVGKSQVAGGINDKERGVIAAIQAKLSAGAESGNIASGKALKLAQLLAQELDKIVGGVGEEPEQEL